MNIGLIHDIDLDGTGASIFIKNAVPLSTSERCRYKDLDEVIYKMGRHVEHLIVADLALEPEQLKTALSKFEHVTLFDHHERSIPYSKLPQNKRLSHNISLKACSAQLAYNTYKEHNEGNAHASLAALINIYDLWKTDHSLFDKAYNLNALYWEYGYEKFYAEFNNGFRPFTALENEWLAELHRRKVEVLENTQFYTLDSGSVVFLTEDKTFTNDYTLHFKDYRVYYLVRYDNYKKSYAVSCRLRRNHGFGDINLDKACTDAWKKGFISPDTVISTGGHKEATGIDFSSKADINDVTHFIDVLDQYVTDQIS